MKPTFDNDYPAVTKILDILRKKGLEIWFQQNTPEFIKQESEKGKVIGKIVHEVIQRNIEKEEISFETDYPNEVKTAIKSFVLFKKENPEIKLKKSEIQLTSEKYKYNGVLDAIAKIKDEFVIFDWAVSTAKKENEPKIYPEKIYQVSAYVMAYNEMIKADIKKAYIVSIAKDKVAYTKLLVMYPVIKACFNEVFLPCLQILNYQIQNEGGNSYGKKQGNTGQRISKDTRRDKNTSQPSTELPSSF